MEGGWKERLAEERDGGGGGVVEAADDENRRKGSGETRDEAAAKRARYRPWVICAGGKVKKQRESVSE